MGGFAPILFVSGTDTGIGKTLVAALLAAGLTQPGAAVGVMKPLESGCRIDENGALQAADAELLLKLSSAGQDIEEVSPFKLSAPLAPAVAAQIEGVSISLEDLKERILKEASRCDILIVEGAGGLLVPIVGTSTYADLVEALQEELAGGVQVLLVVGSRLGAINHASLSFEVLVRRKLKTIGYVLNEFFKEENAVAEFSQAEALRTNRDTLRQAASVYEIPELGFVPFYLEDMTAENVSSLAARLEPLPALREVLNWMVQHAGK